MKVRLRAPLHGDAGRPVHPQRDPRIPVPSPVAPSRRQLRLHPRRRSTGLCATGPGRDCYLCWQGEGGIGPRVRRKSLDGSSLLNGRRRRLGNRFLREAGISRESCGDRKDGQFNRALGRGKRVVPRIDQREPPAVRRSPCRVCGRGTVRSAAVTDRSGIILGGSGAAISPSVDPRACRVEPQMGRIAAHIADRVDAARQDIEAALLDRDQLIRADLEHEPDVAQPLAFALARVGELLADGDDRQVGVPVRCGVQEWSDPVRPSVAIASPCHEPTSIRSLALGASGRPQASSAPPPSVVL